MACSYAVIFINTCCKDLEYKEAKKRGEIAKDLFIEVLEFDEVADYENLRKSAIIETLEDLQRRADEFQAAKGDSLETFLISIVWIGYSLDCDFEPHLHLLNQKDEEVERLKGIYGSLFFKWMEVSAYGEPICINEYATKIAALPSTHVL